MPGEPNTSTNNDHTGHGTFDCITTFVPNQLGLLAAPLCGQANVDKQAVDWGTLWEKNNMYNAPLFNLQIQMLEDLAPALITLAEMTFPGDTGLGDDNASPRALARLSL